MITACSSCAGWRRRRSSNRSSRRRAASGARRRCSHPLAGDDRVAVAQRRQVTGVLEHGLGTGHPGRRAPALDVLKNTESNRSKSFSAAIRSIRTEPTMPRHPTKPTFMTPLLRADLPQRFSPAPRRPPRPSPSCRPPARPGDIGRPQALCQHSLHGRFDAVRLFARPSEWRSIIAAERIVASGLATPLPAMSGALPWLGSYRPCRARSAMPTAACRSNR